MSSFTEFLSALPPTRWNTFILGPLWLTQFIVLAFRQLCTIAALLSTAFMPSASTTISGMILGIVFFLGNFVVLFMPLYEAHKYGVGTLTLEIYCKSQKWKTGWIVAGWLVFVVCGLSFPRGAWGGWQVAFLEICYLAPFLGSFAYGWKLRKESGGGESAELDGF